MRISNHNSRSTSEEIRVPIINFPLNGGRISVKKTSHSIRDLQQTTDQLNSSKSFQFT